MADAPIRWTAAKHIADLFAGRAELDGCQVEVGFPGELKVKGAEYLYLDEIDTAEITEPNMMAGPLDQDDIFELRWVIRVANRKTIDAAMLRACEIDAGIHAIVTGDHTLGDLDGVVSAEIADRKQLVANTTDGPIGHGLTVVRIHSRISPN